MDQFVLEFLKYGAVGLMAGIFLWLYVTEKKEHEKTRTALIQSINDRLSDSKMNMENVTAPIQGFAQSLSSLNDKIESSRGQK